MQLKLGLSFLIVALLVLLVNHTVTHDAASDTKNRAAPATSAGSPLRWSKVRSIIVSRTGSPCSSL